VRLTRPGEIERERNSDATVGRPNDLLRRTGLGDLSKNNTVTLFTTFIVIAPQPQKVYKFVSDYIRSDFHQYLKIENY